MAAGGGGWWEGRSWPGEKRRGKFSFNRAQARGPGKGFAGESAAVSVGARLSPGLTLVQHRGGGGRERAGG